MCAAISTNLLPLLLLVFLSRQQVNGKRILMVTPSPSYSHQIVYRSVSVALHERGHEMVVLTPNPIRNTTMTNYKEIDYSVAYKLKRKVKSVHMAYKYRHLPLEEAYKFLLPLIFNVTMMAMHSPELRQLYAADSNEKFDAVIVEGCQGFTLFSLAHRFNAPAIGIISMDPHMYHYELFGVPILPSHPSTWELFNTTGINVPFWQRLNNFMIWWSSARQWDDYVEMEDKIVKSLFGNDTPHVRSLAKNMSIFLVNQNPILSYARPMPTNFIFFSGVHIATNPPVIRKKLKNFLDNATDGFIYMSLGSNIRSSGICPSTIEAILNVFSKLPYKVLWKYEKELPRKVANVFTAKWLPQQSVLAHPNIKLFISQCGLQSTEEAIHYEVPIIGIPIMFDQDFRITKLQELGVGRRLDLLEINERTFHEAIYDVMNNATYKKRMKEINNLLKDKPYDEMENVVWWVEYVMRHNGAPHLRYEGMNLPWYQRDDYDIVAILSLIIFSTMLLLGIIFVRCVLCRMKNIRAWLLHCSRVEFTSKNNEKDE